MCLCRQRRRNPNVLVLGLFVVLMTGCGGGTTPAPEVAPSGPASSATQETELPPVAAISTTRAVETQAGSAQVETQPGSPEELLLRITEIVAAANTDVERERVGAEDNASDTVSPAEAAYRQRLEKVIDLATQVIAATHLNPDAEQSFNNAVHYLSDARLELASTGDAAQANLLLEDADSLYERDKQSFAAAEAGFKVVELAERMARTLGAEDAGWLKEYATQANHYAQRFPNEPSRAAMGLFTAGRLCDRFHLTDEARQCLEQVQQSFPETVFAEQSAGILRRLSMRGQPLELNGPTIDGGFVEIEHYRGRPVLVVFWSTTSPTFQEHLATIKQLEAKFPREQLAIIGVNLDKDESAVDRFLAKQGLAWPQVFSSDPDLREGRNPVARYYGIQRLPTYWLVSPAGVVVNEQVSIEQLPDATATLVGGR